MDVIGGGLILAAGSSRRYGADKRRALLHENRTLLETSLAVWADALPALRVVLRGVEVEGEAALAQQLQHRWPQLAVTFARNATEGMGVSLATGIHDCASWDYVLVGLGDMPYLQAETLRQLDASLREAIDQGRDEVIVRPVDDGRPGHPVGFGRGHFAALEQLRGDMGAKELIRRQRHHLIEVAVADPGILQDIDTPPSP